MSNPDHVAKLKQGVAAWNLWRGESPDVIPELAGEDLSNREGSDFFGARLEGANFFNTNLEGTDFGSARLKGADFGAARLKGADFGGARLEGADFWEACLEGANFFNANLEGADLANANLKGAYLAEAHLEGADFGSADLSNADLRFATGIRFDDTKILHARLDSQPGALWQRLCPWFILNPLTDPWSTLRRTYTGPNFAVALIALLALLLPLVLQATVWRGVNEAQVIMRNAVAALKSPLEAGLSEFEERAAAIRERAELVPFIDAAEWLAVPEWLLSAVTAVSELKPCLAAECNSFPVWQLLLGWHKGLALVILTLSVLLYGGVRWYVTATVVAYREEEERSGYTPAWAPEPRVPLELPRGRLAAWLLATTLRLEEHPQVWRLLCAVAGYKYLVWLHIFLGCFVLVVVLAGIVNWFGVLSLPVEIPAG